MLGALLILICLPLGLLFGLIGTFLDKPRWLALAMALAALLLMLPILLNIFGLC